MAGKAGKPDLTLPEQKLTSLSFCEASPRAFREWVDGLPIANVGESARQLYHAAIELNQLDINPALRMKLLGQLRPQLNFICDQLSQHFLGRSIALTEKQRKVANLAQALQRHLATGYKIVVGQLAEAPNPDKQKMANAKACHRAISSLGSTLLRASQLYAPSPAATWYEAHQIFSWALSMQITDIAIEDPVNQYHRQTTVEDAYKRLLLLGCCRPNQLRQKELAEVYSLFECWTGHTRILQRGMNDALFVINLGQDAPPTYRNLLRTPLSAQHIGFDSTELAEGLAALADSRGATPAADAPELPVKVSDALLMHLGRALGVLTQRSYRRIESSGILEVAVGMTSVHYFSAGQVTFNQFVDSQDADSGENAFLGAAQRRNDPWASAFDAGRQESMTPPDAPINFRGSGGDMAGESERAYPLYEVSLENTSPGGYCINWNTEMPASLQTGEILGVRENRDHPWSVALIRWIRQGGQQRAQLGIELLGPGAMPCALRLDNKSGSSSEFLRGLLLPELSAIGQPATLLTPRMPFQTGHRITLLRDGEQEAAQLSRRVSATSSISQFELRFRGPSGQGQSSTSDDDDFASLWQSL
ncbi:GTPase [Vreelandella utahensis]|uniref:GTPase n=1 Tax=Vreelandella halophila TaxID=86177 RepID=UPI00098596F2|nr:GTPase [Halomonas utahensis]